MGRSASDTKTEPPTDGPIESRAAWLIAGAGLLLAFAVAATLALTDPRPAPPKPLSAGGDPAAASTLATRALAADDVRKVVADLDYVASGEESSRAAYDTAVARLTRSVDLVSFARTTLEATTSIEWTDLGEGAPRRVTGAEKDELVAEAIERWRRSAREGGGEDAPLGDVLASVLYPPTVPDRNRIDSLVDVMAQGLRPLGLMFGSRSVGLGWSWRVVAVSVVGTDSAEVVYEATASSGAGFAFADASRRYTKLLRFAPDAAGRWRLAAWTNYASVREQFDGNVRPTGVTPPRDRWWGAL